MYDIYEITNNVNQKKYIGQSIRGYEIRWQEHQRDANRGAEYPLYRAIRKHGLENFQIRVIESVDNSEEADIRESFWIKEFDTQNHQFGYNIKAGGARGPLPEIVRQTISASHKQWYIDHPERRLEKGDPFRGIPLPEKQKKHLSKIRTGTQGPPCSEEKKQNNSKKMKKAWIENPWETGASTPEHLEKLQEGLRKHRANMTSEEKQKLSNKLREANKNQFSSEEARKKHSDIMKAHYAKKKLNLTEPPTGY